MADLSSKHPISLITKPQNSRKRQRIDSKQNGGKNDRPKVSLDELDWNEVAMPDRLDDVEGFFGLEEVEGVEVVRNDAGQVEYLLSSTKSKKNKTKQINRKEKEKSKNLNLEDDWPADPSEDLDEEWNGIEDNPVALEGSGGPTVEKETPSTKESKKSKKKPGRTLDLPGIAESTSGVENSFHALEDDPVEEEADVSAWHSLNLASETLLSLARLEFPRPTPIQEAAIPEILAGHDVIGKASTGSGKTIAFGIPILEYFLERQRKKPQESPVKPKDSPRNPPIALILSPTRELAHQISAHLSALFEHSTFIDESPHVVTLTGGLSLQKQNRLLSKADIVIGTPGRLWEIISEGKGLMAWLKKVKYLVVDEADRLLNDGHFKELEEILNVLSLEDDENSESTEDEEVDDQQPGKMKRASRQTLVFSATFHKGLQQKLSGKRAQGGGDLMGKKESMEYLLKKLKFQESKPKFIDVNPVQQMADRLKEGLVECNALEKDLYLYALLLHHPHHKTLIFANSISSVRRLGPFVQNFNLPVQTLHSQMPQKARLRAIERFSSPKTPNAILVATDVAARGLDIGGVQLVLHYHLPRTADMYVHRSGRTARAEHSGASILICAPEEVAGVRRLVSKVHADTYTSGSKSKYSMRTIDLDRRVVSRLKPRVTLAKKIADSMLAKEKHSHEDDWLRSAAEDLGVVYDSEEFEAAESGRKGRGTGRKKAAKEARELTKAEVGALRAELKGLLAQRVNVGVSERYLTAGRVNIAELLREGKGGEFLGMVDELDFHA